MKVTELELLYERIENKDMGEVPMWVYHYIQEAIHQSKHKAMDEFWEELLQDPTVPQDIKEAVARDRESLKKNAEEYEKYLEENRHRKVLGYNPETFEPIYELAEPTQNHKRKRGILTRVNKVWYVKYDPKVKYKGVVDGLIPLHPNDSSRMPFVGQLLEDQHIMDGVQVEFDIEEIWMDSYTERDQTYARLF